MPVSTKDVALVILALITAIITGALSGPYIIPKIFPNTPPSFEGHQILFDQNTPCAAGSEIEVTALASDKDKLDILSYCFVLKNATTDTILERTGWNSGNKWIWKTDSSEFGAYIIDVMVRDGEHTIDAAKGDDQISDVYTLTNGKYIYLQNNCKDTLKVILRYKSPTQGWIVDGIWNIGSGNSFYPVIDDERILAISNTIYYYAYSPNHEIELSGNNVYKFDRKYYDMRWGWLQERDCSSYLLELDCD